ncbi:MAG: diacylglycerol kinase [Acetobacteraceae bacterium]|jgi:diacylglycerol kinase (ATP)|nr:diacylglycerol kinase [Acetobacteraceae bacterium]
MLIIFNPVAGRRRAHLLWRVLDVLAANGVRLDLAETHRAGHAQALALEAARRGEPMVVAAGGDGTIAEVANGLMGSAASLGVIPLGTANVLAHELGLSFAPRSVAAALAFGRTCTLWPGQANGVDEVRLFVQMLGVGFDAHVVHNLPYPLKKMMGKGAYVLQSIRELGRYKFPKIRMRIDDIETEAASVIISKGRFYGGRFRLASDAIPGSPGFSVVLFDWSGPCSTMMYGAALPFNLLGRAPGVRHVRAQRIDFLQNEHVPAQTDGDSAGYAPLWVGDAPGPIRVVVG